MKREHHNCVKPARPHDPACHSSSSSRIGVITWLPNKTKITITGRVWAINLAARAIWNAAMVASQTQSANLAGYRFPWAAAAPAVPCWTDWIRPAITTIRTMKK